MTTLKLRRLYYSAKIHIKMRSNIYGVKSNGLRVWQYVSAVRTLCEVGGGADWNHDVVEGGSVRRREMSVTAVTLLYHIALVACLLTRLSRQNIPELRDNR